MQEDQTEYNPFANLPSKNIQESQSALMDVEQQRAVAEVQSAMIIAKRFKRNQVDAMDRILQACTRPTLAEHALYTYARGGTDITGPSIRLAEAIAQNWGNMQFGIRELSQSNGESTVESYAWDIESNTRQVKTFQVPHTRYSRSKGNVRLSDPRDIYELIANQGARRLRACILGIVPGDVVDAAVKQCEATMATSVKITPALVQSLIDKFATIGITKGMIESRIQRRIEAITPALVVMLGKIFNSLQDGMSTASDWFQAEAEADATAAAKKDLKSKLKEKMADPPPPPSPKKPSSVTKPAAKPIIRCKKDGTPKGVFEAECLECDVHRTTGCDDYTDYLWDMEQAKGNNEN